MSKRKRPGDLPARHAKCVRAQSTTNNAPSVVPPTSPPQLSSMTFNIHGWALEDGIQTRGIYEVINAYNPTIKKGGFEAKIDEIRQGYNIQCYRDDLTFTPRELDRDLPKTDTTVSSYLVVGYTLRDEDPIYKSKKPFQRPSENELVGEFKPSDEHLLRWDEIQTPILIVSPIKQNTGTSVRLFALILPKNGLCKPVLITHERIFYRWEFRVSAGVKSTERNKNWNQIVIDKAFELTPASQRIMNDNDGLETTGKDLRGMVVKQEEIAKGYEIATGSDFELSLDLSKLFRPTTMLQGGSTNTQVSAVTTRIKVRLSAERAAAIQRIQQSNEVELINRQIRDAIDKIRQVKEGSKLQQQHLIYFCDPATEIDVEKGKAVTQEIVRSWPHLKNVIDDDLVMRVKQAINAAELQVELEHVGSLLATATRHVNKFLQIRKDELGANLRQEHQRLSDLSLSTLSQAITGDLDQSSRLIIFLLHRLAQIHHTEQCGLQGHNSESQLQSYEKTEVHYNVTLEEKVSAAVQMGMLKGLLERATAQGGDDLEGVMLWTGRLQRYICQCESTLIA